MKRLTLALLLVAQTVPSPVVDQINTAIDALAKAKALLETPAVIADRLPRPKPALPTLGPAGFTFRDPTFGSRLQRVTDATLDGSRSWRVASNTHLAAWNATGRLFYVINGGGSIAVFNAAGTDTGLRPYSQAEPTFSRVDPDVLFTIGGPHVRTIRKFSVASNQFTDVLELDTVQAVPAESYVGGIVTGGAPETLVAFFGGAGADQHRYVVWYPLDGRPRKFVDTQARFGYRLHSISVDLSGRFVLFYPTNAQPYQVVVWDTQTDTFTPITNDLGPWGHDAVGVGTWINMDTASGPWDAAQWTKRSLLTPRERTNLIDPVLLPQEISLADHSAWRGVGRLISSTYRLPSQTPWRAWDDEIIGIATEGPSSVERYAHHRSDVSEGFWSQPIINCAPTGGRCVFTSNWERSLGADAQGQVRQDVFLVELR